TGSGTGTAKVSVRDISITKHTDRATPVLMKLCCQGKFFKEASLMVHKAGDSKGHDYVVITMKDGMISSVTHGGTGNDERLVETVTLNFKSFKVEYTPQKDGKPGAKIPHGWDIAKNAESQ